MKSLYFFLSERFEINYPKLCSQAVSYTSTNVTSGRCCGLGGDLGGTLSKKPYSPAWCAAVQQQPLRTRRGDAAGFAWCVVLAVSFLLCILFVASVPMGMPPPATGPVKPYLVEALEYRLNWSRYNNTGGWASQYKYVEAIRQVNEYTKDVRDPTGFFLEKKTKLSRPMGTLIRDICEGRVVQCPKDQAVPERPLRPSGVVPTHTFPYVPMYRSGPYAILVILLWDGPAYGNRMNKEQIKVS